MKSMDAYDDFYEFGSRCDKWRGFYLDNAQLDGDEDTEFYEASSIDEEMPDSQREPQVSSEMRKKHVRKPSDVTIQRKIEKAQSERLYTDGELVQEVQRAVRKETSISSAAKRIEVSAKNGIVTLKGQVPSEPEKMTIGDKAASFAGFGKVVNQLEIIDEMAHRRK